MRTARDAAADPADLRLATMLSQAAAAADLHTAAAIVLGELASLTGAARLALLTRSAPGDPFTVAALLGFAPGAQATEVALDGAIDPGAGMPVRLRHAPPLPDAGRIAAWYALPLGDAALVVFGDPASDVAWTTATVVVRLAAPILARAAAFDRRVQEATADLAERNARLVWQSQEIERANRLKSEFLASMSHELRTPINALIGYAALLLDEVLGDVNDRQRTALQRARGSAEHLLTLVNDILDLAKIEAGKLELRLELVPMGELVAEVGLQVEPMVRRKHIDFTIDAGATAPSLHTDRTKAKQILLNLLSNALKFTSQGRIAIAVRPWSDGGALISVRDTGIGIRAEDLPLIWEDFRQLDQSRTREFGGTGLGLSITRKLVERLGGSIDVESAVGVGSTFTVYLPREAPRGADALAGGVEALPALAAARPPAPAPGL